MQYMGSKSRIAKYIVPILQNMIDTNGIKYYYEPFVGGANVIDKIKCEHKIGSDINKYLIALHKRVQCGKSLYESVSRELYNDARDCFNNGTDKYSLEQLGCIGFLASYGCKWFGGYYNEEGKRNYYQEAKNNLLKQAQSPLYKDIQFVYARYYGINPVNSLVYCDPPYQNTEPYGINKNFDHNEFWEWVRDKSWDNYVVVSELNAPSDFRCIWQYDLLQTVGKNNNGNYNKHTEKLFVYGG